MSFKSSVPLTGLAGTIFGIFGIGGSGAQPVPSYLRKLQAIDSDIVVSYDCNRALGSGGANEGVFTVKVKKDEFNDENKKNVLLGGKEVQAKIEYEFGVKGDFQDMFRGWTGKKDGYMSVSNNYYGGGLRIVLKEERANYGRLSDVTLYCRVVEDGKANDIQTRRGSEQIFDGLISFDGSSKNVSLKNWSGSARVSLYNCPMAVSDSGSTTCDLKLTDLAGWRWRVKANSKAKFELTPVEKTRNS